MPRSVSTLVSAYLDVVGIKYKLVAAQTTQTKQSSRLIANMKKVAIFEFAELTDTNPDYLSVHQATADSTGFSITLRWHYDAGSKYVDIRVSFDLHKHASSVEVADASDDNIYTKIMSVPESFWPSVEIALSDKRAFRKNNLHKFFRVKYMLARDAIIKAKFQ